MTKPHEQEWTMDRHLIVNEYGKGICRMQGSAATAEAEALILAAPDMARALLALLPEEGMARNHTRECLKWRTDGAYITECLPGCILAMSALRKAGVL